MTCTFDLNERTVHVYRELVRLGAQPVSVLARKTGVKRTTLYYALERLSESGMIEMTSAGNHRMCIAKPAGAITQFFDAHREELATYEQALQGAWRGEVNSE